MTATVTVWSPANPPRRSWLDRVGRSLRAAFAKLTPLERGFPWGDRPVVADGSVVRVFDVDSLRETTIVVAPGQATTDAAMAAALIGAGVGETREWESPSGRRRMQIVWIAGRVAPSASTRPESASRATLTSRP